MVFLVTVAVSRVEVRLKRFRLANQTLHSVVFLHDALHLSFSRVLFQILQVHEH